MCHTQKNKEIHQANIAIYDSTTNHASPRYYYYERSIDQHQLARLSVLQAKSLKPGSLELHNVKSS